MHDGILIIDVIQPQRMPHLVGEQTDKLLVIREFVDIDGLPLRPGFEIPLFEFLPDDSANRCELEDSFVVALCDTLYLLCELIDLLDLPVQLRLHIPQGIHLHVDHLGLCVEIRSCLTCKSASYPRFRKLLLIETVQDGIFHVRKLEFLPVGLIPGLE